MPPQNPDQNTQSTMAPPESSPQPSQPIEPDYGKLPPQLQAKLQKWHQNGQENQQLGGFQDVAKTLQMAVTALNIVAMHLSDSENQSKEAAQQYTDLLQKMQGALSNLDNIQQFDQVLGDMHQTLSILKDVERPEMPDYAQPVVEAVSRLESALTSSLEGIKTQPDVHVTAPEVPAPQVSVDVDLKRVEQILSKDIPKAFDKAIKSIPKTDIPENDQKPLLDKLGDILEQLGSIDTATRMKPIPGSMRISNLTESPIPVSDTAAMDHAPTQMQSNASQNGNGMSLNVDGYATAIVHIISSTTMSGGTTVNFEASVDSSTWTAITAQTVGSATLATSTTSDGDFRINVVGFNFLRARISSYSAGRTSIVGYASTQAPFSTTVGLATGTSSIGDVGSITTAVVPGTAATNLGKAEDAGHTTGDTGVMALAVRNDTATALAGTTLDYIPFTTDANGGLWISLATLIAGENLTTNRLNVEPIYSYLNITTATTTTVKSGAGTLHVIAINTPVASATITVYDNTAGSGTKIGTISLGGTLANDVYDPVLLDVSFGTGLTIVTSGATDLTIGYR
jgi:hypothetical protein